nr:flagellar motor switch protein FliG [candidate division KSB1 bacterium]NIV72617.1 flagellar motor switch protein FliG [Calditrichia bacterium]NIV99751.1 flagellar motor switch protein FliG [Candidatus Saccharibacteria bacterium]NIW80112.1 flagellar motor switch protein FliG [Calditrichia bacterium]
MSNEMEKMAIKDEELDGKQRAAILMISFDEATAAKVFQQLNKQEILKLSSEIAKIESVLSKTINRVNQEFFQLIKAREYVATGGLDFAQTVLEKAFGLPEAKEMMEKMRNSLQTRGFVALKKADSSQLVNFLNKEHPQTIALILSYLEPEQTADILAEFPEDLQIDVAHRIGTLGKISPNLLRDIEEVIEELSD